MKEVLLRVGKGIQNGLDQVAIALYWSKLCILHYTPFTNQIRQSHFRPYVDGVFDH